MIRYEEMKFQFLSDVARGLEDYRTLSYVPKAAEKHRNSTLAEVVPKTESETKCVSKCKNKEPCGRCKVLTTVRVTLKCGRRVCLCIPCASTFARILSKRVCDHKLTEKVVNSTAEFEKMWQNKQLTTNSKCKMEQDGRINNFRQMQSEQLSRMCTTNSGSAQNLLEKMQDNTGLWGSSVGVSSATPALLEDRSALLKKKEEELKEWKHRTETAEQLRGRQGYRARKPSLSRLTKPENRASLEELRAKNMKGMQPLKSASSFWVLTDPQDGTPVCNRKSPCKRLPDCWVPSMIDLEGSGQKIKFEEEDPELTGMKSAQSAQHQCAKIGCKSLTPSPTSSTHAHTFARMHSDGGNMRPCPGTWDNHRERDITNQGSWTWTPTEGSPVQNIEHVPSIFPGLKGSPERAASTPSTVTGIVRMATPQTMDTGVTLPSRIQKLLRMRATGTQCVKVKGEAHKV